MIDQCGTEHARQLLDLVDAIEDLLFMLDLEYYHQLSPGGVTVNLHPRQPLEIGQQRGHQLGTTMNQQAGDMQGAGMEASTPFKPADRAAP